MMTKDATISPSRRGLTNNCARLRDHISSMNGRLTPRLARNSTSHSNTAEINTPAASATQVEWPKKNLVTKPHSTIWIIGQ